MQEKRKHVRTTFRAHVKLTHPSIGEFDVELRDLSDGGVFLFTANCSKFPIGELVQIQSLDIENAPVLSARVMRHEADGIGLMFLEE